MIGMPLMIRVFGLVIFGMVLSGLVASSGTAQTGWLFGKEKLGVVMTAQDAHERAMAGQVVLVDVRSSAEWRKSGVPASGFAITMHQDPRVFTEQLNAAMGGDKSRPLALICATGVRTTYLQEALKKLGFSKPINVTEGMMGGRYGDGWIKRGLPVRSWSKSGDLKPTLGPGAL
ncbi:MAG: rhodanese-like domain-containing protein [Pseudomonadota bacterium]